MRSKISLLVIVVLILTIIVPVSAFAQTELKVKVDGELISFDTALAIENGRILVPLNGVFEKLGAEIKWDKANEKVFVDDKYTTVELTINQKTAYVHRKFDFTGIPEKVKLDVAAKVIDGTVMVPLRFVVESLGAKVDWDGENRTAVINSKGDIIPIETLVSYNIVATKDIKDNAELLKWYEENSRVEGIYYKTVNSETYVLASAGEKPTGGYNIQIESATMVSPGNVYITAKVVVPSPDEIVTQAITYPNILIKLDTTGNVKADGLITISNKELSN